MSNLTPEHFENRLQRMERENEENKKDLKELRELVHKVQLDVNKFDIHYQNLKDEVIKLTKATDSLAIELRELILNLNAEKQAKTEVNAFKRRLISLWPLWTILFGFLIFLKGHEFIGQFIKI